MFSHPFLANPLEHNQWFDFCHPVLVLLFLELHLNGIIEYLFLLLGSFIQDNVSEIYSGCFIIINLSLFVACNNSTLYEYTMFVYSPVVGRLGCFQFLSIKSKSYWGYFRTRLFMDLVFIFLEKYLTVELQVLKQMGSARCFRTHPRGSHVIPEEGSGQEGTTWIRSWWNIR